MDDKTKPVGLRANGLDLRHRLGTEPVIDAADDDRARTDGSQEMHQCNRVGSAGDKRQDRRIGGDVAALSQRRPNPFLEPGLFAHVRSIALRDVLDERGDLLCVDLAEPGASKIASAVEHVARGQARGTELR